MDEQERAALIRDIREDLELQQESVEAYGRYTLQAPSVGTAQEMFCVMCKAAVRRDLLEEILGKLEGSDEEGK